MNLQLIQGQFTSTEAIELISQFVSTKIRFQEDKITASSNEEDIKMRERRIKQLQQELNDMRVFIETNGSVLNVRAAIEIQPAQ